MEFWMMIGIIIIGVGFLLSIFVMLLVISNISTIVFVADKVKEKK